MNTLKTSLLALGTLLVFTQAQAEKTKLKSGSVAMLKGVTEMNVQYEYHDMTVTTKNKPEAEFIENKKAEYNKKEAGKGDKWATSWVADRSTRYEPQFKEQFEEKSKIKIGGKPDAKYTIIVHTTHTETGYNIGISRRNAYIDAEVKIVETANPDKVLALFTVTDAQGGSFGGYDFDTGSRLQECYAIVGKAIGKYIAKKAK